MNWGIFSLLVVVACVLGRIAAFFIFIARKAAAAANLSIGDTASQPIEKV
jgi:hypothetical protein